MQIKVRLDRFLARHVLSPSGLARKLRGQVSQSTIYALCRPDQVKRLDLHTLSGVLEALRQMTGQDVSLSDILEEVHEGSVSEQVSLLLTAPPADWGRLTAHCGLEEAELDSDESFWQDHRERQRRLEQLRPV